MAIRSFQLEKQPTDLLARRLRSNPACKLTRGELCRRGESQLARQIVLGEEEDRALETMGPGALAARAHALDRATGDLAPGIA